MIQLSEVRLSQKMEVSKVLGDKMPKFGPEMQFFGLKSFFLSEI